MQRDFPWLIDGRGSNRQQQSPSGQDDAPDEALLTLASQLAGAAQAVAEAQLALSSLGTLLTMPT